MYSSYDSGPPDHYYPALHTPPAGSPWPTG